MSSSRSAVWSVAILGLVAIGGAVLLVRAFGREGRSDPQQVDQTGDEAPATATATGGAADEPAPRAPTPAPVARATGSAAAPPLAGSNGTDGGLADGGAGDGPAAAALTNPTKSRGELKVAAEGKQLALYQKRLATVIKQRERLMQTVARLKREGAAAEQLESMQRRVQQLIEAEPRMRQRLEQLEAAAKKQ